MPKYRIQDETGYFDVTDDGNIIRLDQKDFKPSGQWKLRGIVDNRHRMVVHFPSLFNWLMMRPSLKLKNGKPRYHVADLDHGTNRVWGSGIIGIWGKLE